VKLKHQCLELRLAHRWTIARGVGVNQSQVVVTELMNGDGLVGLGEAAPIIRYDETVDTVQAFCNRVNPSQLSFEDIPGSMRYLDSLSPSDMSAKCALNIALLDGAAKQAKRPIYDFLGLGFREQQHVTSFTIGIDKPEVIKQKVAEAKKYPVLKVKLGVADDKLTMQALRGVAPTIPVRVDANEGWATKEEALRSLEWLAADGNIQFVEQPMPVSTPARDLSWLKERSPLPLFADELYHHAKDVALCSERFHGVNVKLVKAGGITGAHEALLAARKAGLKTMIGCMIESSLLISAAAHLAALADHLDLDGNLLITNDLYAGVTADKGVLSFASTPETTGLRVRHR